MHGYVRLSDPDKPHEWPKGEATFAASDGSAIRHQWKSWTEVEVMAAVNATCSCGGKGPEDGCCQACEVWHRLQGWWNNSPNNVQCETH